MTSAKNIDASAQSPSGVQFAFMNGKNNKFYVFDQSNTTVKLIMDCDSERKNANDEPVAIAMPEENLIYTVWRSKAKIVFKKIRPGVRKSDIHEQDLRDVYDGCSQRDNDFVPL